MSTPKMSCNLSKRQLPTPKFYILTERILYLTKYFYNPVRRLVHIQEFNTESTALLHSICGGMGWCCTWAGGHQWFQFLLWFHNAWLFSEFIQYYMNIAWVPPLFWHKTCNYILFATLFIICLNLDPTRDAITPKPWQRGVGYRLDLDESTHCNWDDISWVK